MKLRMVDGQWILLAFLTLFGVLLFQNANSLLGLIVLLICFAYLCYVFTVRKINLLYLLLPAFIIALGSWQNFVFLRQTEPSAAAQIYELRPDKGTLKEDYFFGEASGNGKKVAIQLKPSPELVKLLQVGRPFLIRMVEPEASLIDGPTNIGEFDLRAFYKTKNIKYQLEVAQYEVAAKRASLFDYVIQFRSKLKQRLLKLPDNLRFFAGELFLGENLSEGEHDLVNDFRNMGIIHLLSLSGLHVVLYTQFVGFLFNLFRWNAKAKELFMILLLLAVCIIGNFQAGLVRASLAYATAAFLRWRNIKLNSLDQFGIVALIHQLFVPSLFLLVGAQLSYLMVLALKIIPAKNAFIQSLLLNVIITPILLQNFFEMNVLTIAYNLVAIPVFNFVILPVTLLAVFVGVVFTGIVAPSEGLLQFISGGISFFGKLGFGQVTFGAILPSITLISIILLIGWQIFKSKTKMRQSFVLIATGLLCGNVLLNYFPLKGQVTFIDVGQGDSVLLTTPGQRKTVLIDTGGKLNFGGSKPKRSNFDKIGTPFLKSEGISRIDAVFLSHQDADHIGDLVDLLKNFRVQTVYFGAGMQENPSFQKKIMPFVTKIKFVPLKMGDEVRIAGIDILVLHPSLPGIGTNEDSLSLKILIGGKKWLFTGDLDIAGEQAILAGEADVKADFFKLGHHGSKTSSDEEFLKAVNPSMAFISAGRNNRYGHPHAETLRKLERLGIQNQNTAEYGMINWYFSPFRTSWLSHFLR